MTKYKSNNYKILATTSFGLESILGFELNEHGYKDLEKENGKVYIHDADINDIPFLNINLRTAERIVILLDSFKCRDFDDLYDNLIKIKWEDIISKDGQIIVNFKSSKSQIKSISNSQSISKRAIIDCLKRKHQQDWFSENGAKYKINVSIVKDIAEISLDSTGHGLHKRGYRLLHGEAPLRETLAASLINISRWRCDEPLIDPFCGSGTILIEAAMKALNIAPGLNASFDSFDWDIIPRNIWNQEYENAKNKIKHDFKTNITGYDIDPEMISIAKKNAEKAGVESSITFKTQSIDNFDTDIEKGFIITNPPYGERLNKNNLNDLYKSLEKSFNKIKSWRKYIFTGDENFLNNFSIKSFKNRKLYNGKIRCYLHMFKGDF